MDKKFREALSEIYEILLYIDQKSFDEIPFEVIFFFFLNKSKEYDFKIDENEKELGEIIENKISEETKEILAYLYLKYWNKNEDENLQKELVAIEETMKLQGLYDIFTLDMSNPILEESTVDIDKNANTNIKETNDNDNEKALIKNENIFVKIKNMIIKFFRKFGKNKE